MGRVGDLALETGPLRIIAHGWGESRPTEGLVVFRSRAGVTGVLSTDPDAVGVARIARDASHLLDVFVGEVRPASEDTAEGLWGIRIRGAVHELLLRERNEWVSSKEPLTLDIPASRKGPTRAYRPLIFHWGDRTVLGPVKSCWERCSIGIRKIFEQVSV